MVNPLVTIIIPVFNRATLIIETLESINSQTYKNWECIIIDDKSTDDTVEVIKNYCIDKKFFSVNSLPDSYVKGACSCRNYGFTLAKGDYINWFDSDDIMHVDFLKRKVEKLNSSLTIDAVISKTAFFSSSADIITGHENRTYLTNSVLEDFIALKVSWYLPDVMWRKSFLINKPLFDEELLMGQDRFFHIKLLSFFPNLVLVDEYLTFYRKHNDSISATYFNKKHTNKTISHFKSVVKLVDFLKEKNVLNKQMKISFQSAAVYYLPHTYNKKINSELKKYLNQLFVVNISSIKNMLKFYLALISYKLIGKGYFIIKK